MIIFQTQFFFFKKKKNHIVLMNFKIFKFLINLIIKFKLF